MSKARSDKPVKVDLGKTLGDRIARLKDPDVIRALGAKTVKRLRKQVVAEILRAKREACSPVWSDDVIHRGVEYPPGGKDTGMVRCATCQVWHPADYLTTSGHCCECEHAAMSRFRLKRLVSSPGVIDMGRLKASFKGPKKG